MMYVLLHCFILDFVLFGFPLKWAEDIFNKQISITQSIFVCEGYIYFMFENVDYNEKHASKSQGVIVKDLRTH